MRWLVVVALAACGKPERAAPAGEPPVGVAPVGVPEPCREVAFAETTPVPEASGAAWLDDRTLIVVGDSGNDGAYGILDPETGETREQGLLPLGPERHDDVEGLAVRGARLVGITSPGWILEWERRGGGFELVAGPYPLGPVDVARGQDDGMVCAARRGNCGRNYEGLCLAPAPGARCVGFAAAKADGHLYCLVERDGQLAVVREGAIAVARPGAIADCAFGDDGAVYVGGNLLDLGRVYRVTGWDAPERARVEVLGSYGTGNPEVLALRGDVMLRMSDTNGAPSLVKRYRCGR